MHCVANVIFTFGPFFRATDPTPSPTAAVARSARLGFAAASRAPLFGNFTSRFTLLAMGMSVTFVFLRTSARFALPPTAFARNRPFRLASNADDILVLSLAANARFLSAMFWFRTSSAILYSARGAPKSNPHLNAALCNGVSAGTVGAETRDDESV